jgi:hypothetical protein
MPNPIRSLALGLACVQLAACYSYRVVTTEAVAPGSNVRVTLSSEEALRQQQSLGVLRQQLEGLVLTAGDAEIGIAVPRPPGSPAERSGLNTLVTLPATSILRIEEKHFSAGKTALVAAAGAGAALAVFAIVEASTGNGGEGPGTNELIRVPIGRIFFR